jgi:probable F420-dependent oxidoreductase
MVDIGICFTHLLGPSPTAGDVIGCAQRAEELGFHSFVVSDHILTLDSQQSAYPAGTFPPDVYWPDPFVILAAIAGATRTIRLGTGIVVVPYRAPIQQAQAVATLDFMSGGRFDFGVGIGWMREEYEALGIPFSQRGRRTDEYLDVMKTLWSESSRSFSGEFTEFSGARLNPKPVQLPNPPILVGGETPAALRRIARRGDGFCINWKTLPEFEALIDALTPEMAAEGRSISELYMQLACTTLEPVQAELSNMSTYEQLGLDEIVFMPSAGSPTAGLELMDEIAAKFL